MAHPRPLGDGHVLMTALERLAHTIDTRHDSDPEISYTAKLLARGPLQAAKKLGEEGVECALAISSQDEEAVANEAADLLYHLWVALRTRGVALDAVGKALADREGRSGLEERARRPKD